MKILLHICCSNCALYPFRILGEAKHEFTGFWFNPNIHPHDEYNSRLDSVKNLTSQWNIEMIYKEKYTPEDYLKMMDITDDTIIDCIYSGNSSVDLNDFNVPKFPERCKSCYHLRLEKTAETAKREGFEAFSTTLLISPYQDFDSIVATGTELAEKYSLSFHINDYRPHFRDAMSLSKELGLYRQKYCGCIFSRDERNQEKANKKPARTK